MPEDRLLEGEDPQTVFAHDARHWIAVYREMIDFKDQLLARVEDQLRRLPRAARSDVTDNDIGLIQNQLERYKRRIEFWYSRQWELEGLQVDLDTRVITYRERSVRLTKRELELLTMLVSRSPQYITARQLLVQAWHDARLPEETLRTYIVRLRGKVAQLGIGAEIVNRPRRGYALVFAEKGSRSGGVSSTA
jgi:DNA-binding response OmpR family regulator